MAFQHQADPTNMLLTAKVIHERNPDVVPAPERLAQRGDDGLGLAEIVLVAGLVRSKVWAATIATPHSAARSASMVSTLWPVSWQPRTMTVRRPRLELFFIGPFPHLN